LIDKLGQTENLKSLNYRVTGTILTK